MTDRERLKNKIDYLQKVFMEDDDYDYFNEFLADRLIEDKDVIVPPCKVGDKVYCIEYNLKIIEEYTVNGYTIKNGKLALLVFRGIYFAVVSEWFLTKEEAEEKLKELGK